MFPDLAIMVFAIPAVLFAGISKGGFGSGAAFAAAPLLALVIDPAMAIGLLLPLLMLMDFVSLRFFWGGWHRPSVLALMLGALPGVALGVWFFQQADADMLRILIGVIALLFVAYQLARSLNWLKIPHLAFRWSTGLGTGAVVGFTSFVSHAGGPPAAIFLLAQGLSKGAYQATSVVVFWFVNIAKAIPYAMIGLFSTETLVLDLWLAPFAVIGALLGVKAHHVVPERGFFAITYVLLVFAGCKLIWDALT
ncbi:sulfite exporter TauE/SafE family protein [Aliiruegeria sabulilitoris]|uniref:sulfite exporter TauE/SafE family protein n=1 Tax=Aliiruegeria sabulilitoris TaxID=1510458 RepID=UPI00082AD312|nr:sulfite exporter TauE/SafE family protein [Aliiruegeria sabulilitoris]NDR58947.1 sulfite exporter TauE/SafE family protein [Pseudoruegeria sp. M32A2M]